MLSGECVQENVLTDGDGEGEGEGSGEECEVTDECAMLLNSDGGSTLHKVLKATAAAHKHGTPHLISFPFLSFCGFFRFCVLLFLSFFVFL